MRDRIAARRYAEGFLNFSRRNIGIKSAFDQLSELTRIIKAVPALEEFLESPEICFSDKAGFIERVFKTGFSQQTRNFLEFVIKKGRISQLDDIAAYAKVIYQRERGIEKAILNTALGRDEKLLYEVKRKLEKNLDKKLESETRVNSDLIGGVQAIVGNVVIDGTVKKKLSDLRENLLNIKVS